VSPPAGPRPASAVPVAAAAAEPAPLTRTNNYEPPQSWYDDCDLEAGAAKLLWYGPSRNLNSRRTYGTARNSYVLFCAHRGLTPLPANSTILCSWVHSLAERRLQHETIKLVVRGCKRESPPASGPGPRMQRMPLTRPILSQLLAGMDPTNPEEVTLRAAFCLAHAAFLRIGKFTWSPKDM
jgi:hypothetical protein